MARAVKLTNENVVITAHTLYGYNVTWPSLGKVPHLQWYPTLEAAQAQKLILVPQTKEEE